jgi:FkbM family methyltransferase
VAILFCPNILRRGIEKLSRFVFFRRRLPERFGAAPIYVTPSSALAFWFKPLEQLDSAMFNRIAEFVKPGDSVWDVGANVGMASFAAAARAGSEGSVVAFEPDSFLVYLLRRSAALAGPNAAHVHVVPTAVADKVGIARFHLARRARSSNHLAGFGESQTGGSARVDWTATMTLDSMLAHFRPPSVLKIDVEAAEELVLSGASTILREHQPIILCEVSHRAAAAVTALLKEHGYTLYDLEAAPDARHPLELASANIVALPTRDSRSANESGDSLSETQACDCS